MNLHFYIDDAAGEYWGWTNDTPGFYPATPKYQVDRIVLWAPEQGGLPSPELLARARAAWPHRHTVAERIGEVRTLLAAAREADERAERLKDRAWALGYGHWPNPSEETTRLAAAIGAALDRAFSLRLEAEAVRWAA